VTTPETVENDAGTDRLKEKGKANHRTFVHFPRQPLGRIIPTVAKTISERPFVSLRVTNLLWSDL